jgi:hypothetical protein
MTAKPIMATPESSPQTGITNIEIIRSEPSAIVQVQGLDEDCVIAADAIREILATAKSSTPQTAAPAEPVVVRIGGAWIRGELDLDTITQVAGGLYLTGCKLDQPVTLRDGALNWLVLEQCVLPGIGADRATVGTLTITDSLITGENPGGAIRLTGTRVTGDLRLDGIRVDNPVGPAVQATGLAAGAGVSMEAVDARGTGPAGVICLTEATVSGDLTLRGARLIAGSGPAFNAPDMTVKGAARLDRGFTATGAGAPGAVCLAGASIAGELSLRGASLANGSGPALAADLITVRSGIAVDQDFRAIGSGDLATIRLAEATVGGDLVLDGATLANRTGPALAADLITVTGSVSMNGSAWDGTLFSATGAAGRGTVQLSRARISGQLSLSGAVLTNGSGPALVADRATVRGDALLDGGFTATGGGEQRAAVSLAGATIGRGLTCSGQAASQKPDAPGLDLGQATVGSLVLSASFAAAPAGGTPLNVDGLTYTELPVLLSGNPPVQVPQDRQAREWISCLRHSAAYSAGAYRALAAAFQRCGDSEAARRILAAQRDDARARGTRGGRKARRSALAMVPPAPAAAGLRGPVRTPAEQA